MAVFARINSALTVELTIIISEFEFLTVRENRRLPRTDHAPFHRPPSLRKWGQNNFENKGTEIGLDVGCRAGVGGWSRIEVTAWLGPGICDSSIIDKYPGMFLVEKAHLLRELSLRCIGSSHIGGNIVGRLLLLLDLLRAH